MRWYSKEAHFGCRVPNSHCSVMASTGEQVQIVHEGLAYAVDLAPMAPQSNLLLTRKSVQESYSTVCVHAC